MRRELAARGVSGGPALRLLLSLSSSLLSLVGCAATVPFPWPAPAPAPAASAPPAAAGAAGHAEVATVNAGYRRTTSQALVRRIDRPTRANLDWAAYHGNFMNADPEPEGLTAAAGGKRPDTRRAPFGGVLDPATLTGTVTTTPLSDDERRHPLAFAPLVELLVSKHVPGGDKLEDVGAAIRAEDFGLGGGPQAARQTAAEIYLHDPGHDPGADKPVEVWIKIEVAPWFKAFSGLADEDGDGFAEIYGRVPGATLGGSETIGDLIAFVRGEYAGRLLSPAEIKAWAHQLASYWYPSYNTDLVPPAAAWPDAETEAAVRAELGGQRFALPAVVMRGKPQGKPVYNVFLVAAEPAVTAAGGATPAVATAPAPAPLPLPPLALPRTQPTPDTRATADAVRAELAAHGGSWARWNDEVAPLHAAVRRQLAAIRPSAKATAGSDGFLFFKQSLAYVVGGDLTRQKGAKNPVPTIAAFQKLLAAHGVDLLFVPVPTKAEVYADKLGGAKGAPAAAPVVNPFERKLLIDLADAGVETVDLLPLFLRIRARDAAGDKAEPLYQRQDTHWTARGLELAARAVAERVKRYPWYASAPLARARRRYVTRDAPFSRHGDLVSRLSDADRGRLKLAPESLVGHQVVAPNGALYDDDDGSPIVVLGDSFTGVFQLMDCEHAGVSAHLAKELGLPVDLVMSYGGGPNVRQKLLRRGADALGKKKLVIWMMTARDLYDFSEGWQALSEK